jgi:hypothetical protein
MIELKELVSDLDSSIFALLCFDPIGEKVAPTSS